MRDVAPVLLFGFALVFCLVLGRAAVQDLRDALDDRGMAVLGLAAAVAIIGLMVVAAVVLMVWSVVDVAEGWR